ncbi:MAG: cell division protein ZapD [Pseudomonadota bacterium]
MVFAAENSQKPQQQPAVTTFEQPLNERMRTFLRLEFLYHQTEYNVADPSETATRQAIDGILEIAAILTRGDVRSEVLKELERQIAELQNFATNPSVDRSRLDAAIDELDRIRDATNAIGPHYLQPLKDSEFLSAIKHRTAIPGGTCEFDLPLFGHWLRKPYEARREDLDQWLRDLRPLCGGVKHIMWLIRQNTVPQPCVAECGMFQHSIGKETSCRMLRVTLSDQTQLFPEVSGSPHRFTIRFMTWPDVQNRPVQTSETVEFALSIC